MYVYHDGKISAMAPEGLREKKKQATRRQISDVATGLFALRGFDNVTIAEIAEAAQVAKKTVTNYFPRKEDLFLDRQADRLQDLERVVRERAPGESVAAAMRAYQHTLLATGHPLSGIVPRMEWFLRILRSSQALMNRVREFDGEIEECLHRVLAEEVGDDLRARLIARQLTATMTAIYAIASDRMYAGGDYDQVRRDQVDVIDQAFDLLEHGIGTYGTR
jgi:AcrR family transcriptional regulator